MTSQTSKSVLSQTGRICSTASVRSSLRVARISPDASAKIRSSFPRSLPPSNWSAVVPAQGDTAKSHNQDDTTGIFDQSRCLDGYEAPDALTVIFIRNSLKDKSKIVSQ